MEKQKVISLLLTNCRSLTKYYCIMKLLRNISFITVVFILYSNCAVAQTNRDVEVGSFETTIIFNGEPSNVAYYVPLDYNADNSYKLIVGLHYCTGSPSAYMSYRNLLIGLSDSLNAIIMCPDCHMPGYPYNIPDSSIISKSTDSTIALYNINQDYMYLTGGSCNGKSTIKYGLEYIHNYRGIISFNPYIGNTPSGYFDLDSKMPTVICSGTLDPSYNYAVRVYDSLVAHNANAKFISMEGIGHDFWIPEFNIEMMNGIHYIDSIVDIITSSSYKTENNFNIKVYPNPFKNRTNIEIQISELSKDYQLLLIDIYGNLIETIFNSKLTTHKSKHNLSTRNKGAHFLKLISDDNIITKKIISI